MLSVLGCPIVKKRKLEEAEENQSAPKRRSQPVQQEGDGEDITDEDEDEDEEEAEEEDQIKDKKKNTTKIRAEAAKGERGCYGDGEQGRTSRP